MKYIISPSKTQNLDNSFDYIVNKPLFHHKTLEYIDFLKTISHEEYAKIAKIKEDKAKIILENMCSPNLYKEAIYSYTGMVFKQLELDSFSSKMKTFLNDNLFITSAMFGLLKPTDHIFPYRLDFMMKFKDYNFLESNKNVISNYIEKELENETIVSLASKEFNNLFDPNKIVIIDFAVRKNDKLVRQSTQMKIIRGKFLNEVIKNKIDDLNNLKKLTVDDFVFCKDTSSDLKLVYIKK